MGEVVACRYVCFMQDVGKLLGDRLRAIRRQVAGTQEAFCERAGISQPYLSDLERGNGWASLRTITDAIEAAGGDPADLFRADPPARPQEAELRELAAQADPDLLDVVVRMMRLSVRRADQKAG